MRRKSLHVTVCCHVTSHVISVATKAVNISQLSKPHHIPHHTPRQQNPAASAMEFDDTIQLPGLFNNPEYSDLTIKLSDGQELHVHKLVVCARNDYFLKLCGPGSQFAVRLITQRSNEAKTNTCG
jgi:hypothetical protein